MNRQASWRVGVTLILALGSVGVIARRVFTQSPDAPVFQSSEALRSVVVLNNRNPRKLRDMTVQVPSDNPQTEAKVALGRRLFFDKVLSNDRSVSCSTCHDPEHAFADERPQAVGVFGRAGRRNSPTLVNRGFGRVQFWDGRAPSLEAQVVQPISDRNEMDLAIDVALERLTADESYRTAFNDVFGGPVTAVDLGRALASYVRSIRSGDSPYDRFVEGATDALTPDQRAGLDVFRGRANCWVCHAEPTFSDEQFRNTGIAWQAGTGDSPGSFADDGRFGVSGVERDRGGFKTPTLREVARTAPYMHDGSLATLDEVVEFYSAGGRRNPNLFPLVRPINLTDTDKRALVAFLESLTGTISR